MTGSQHARGIPSNPARRALLRGRVREMRALPPPRLPWALPEPAFSEGCTRCGRCSQACPEHIVVDRNGLPELDFQRGECTFCGACVEACPQPIFSDLQSLPWEQKAMVTDECIGHRGVACQVCRDVCMADAIRFSPANARRPVPELDAQTCTGCGACVGACPVQALQVVPGQGATA